MDIPAYAHIKYREKVGKRMHLFKIKAWRGKIGSTDLKAPVVGLLTKKRTKNRTTKKYH